MHPDRRLKQRIKSFAQHKGVLGLTDDIEIVPLAGGGSDRIFIRMKSGKKSFVVMVYSRLQWEIRSYLDVAAYLSGLGIGVPQIIAGDESKHMVIMEDIGDVSMYVLLKHSQTREEAMGYYKDALTALAEMQIKATPDIETSNYLKNRLFGYQALRWETDYFVECFIKRFLGIGPVQDEKLEDELHWLASVPAQEPHYFMHRDFQSQNIFFKEGRVRIVDFQTATRGPLQYDAAALLKDAYFVLEDHERDMLLNFYIDVLIDTWGVSINREKFVEIFHLMGLQRNMQALGAFAFLSMDKGKPEFIQYIPAAVSYLKKALTMFPEFCILNEIVNEADSLVRSKELIRTKP